jgi:simple sugar transport system ATP-binding protein
VETLFKVLRQLTSEGCSILYISHKLEEIKTLCDSATILRGGRVVETCIPKNETAKSLAELMSGDTLKPPKRDAREAGEVRLKVDGLTSEDDDEVGSNLHNINLKVRAGEILGIAGVAGNGQHRLLSALVGEFPSEKKENIQINGKAVGHIGPDGRRALGLCCVPEERLGHAAVPEMSLVENICLSARVRKGLNKKGFLNISRAREMAEEVVKAFKVKTAGVEHSAQSLSGGNLQKFIMGREIKQDPDIFVASQPTWGVDAGAASEIHKAILRLAREGAAVLIISQDLDELFSIADRISVISEGSVSEPTDVEDLTVEKIGLQMGEKAIRKAAHA